MLGLQDQKVLKNAIGRNLSNQCCYLTRALPYQVRPSLKQSNLVLSIASRLHAVLP